MPATISGIRAKMVLLAQTTNWLSCYTPIPPTLHRPPITLQLSTKPTTCFRNSPHAPHSSKLATDGMFPHPLAVPRHGQIPLCELKSQGGEMEVRPRGAVRVGGIEIAMQVEGLGEGLMDLKDGDRTRIRARASVLPRQVQLRRGTCQIRDSLLSLVWL